MEMDLVSVACPQSLAGESTFPQSASMEWITACKLQHFWENL